MSLIKILAVWTPESILNLIIVILIAGLRDKLNLKKSGNLIQFISALFCMVLSSIVLSVLVETNVVINYIYHIAAYAIIFSLIYKLDLRKALLSVLLMLFTFATLENSYYPFLVSYVSGGIEQYNNNLTHYILFSCITRTLQLGLIVFLIKNQYVFLLTRLDKKMHNIFTIFISFLLICETCVSYMYAFYFNQLSLQHQIIYGLVIVIMIVLYYALIYKVIYSSIKGVIIQGYKQYQMLEQGAEEAFKSVYSLLSNDDVDSAKNYISLLLGSDEKINSNGGDKYEG